MAIIEIKSEIPGKVNGKDAIEYLVQIKHPHKAAEAIEMLGFVQTHKPHPEMFSPTKWYYKKVGETGLWGCYGCFGVEGDINHQKILMIKDSE